MYRLISISALFSLAIVSPAQQVRQHALGFVLEGGTSRVRPLWGVPSAARVGDPIDLGGDVAASAASPNQDYLVFLSGSSRSAQIWSQASGAIERLAGVPPGATQVVLSPEGRSAAFFYAETNQVHVITGLPGTPAAGFDADLSVLLNPLNHLAVSDDGALLLASEGFEDGHASPAVVVLRANGVAGRIAVSGPASAIAFLSNSHDGLISDPSGAFWLQDVAAQTSRFSLPLAAASSTGVLASSDGSRAIFASPARGGALIVSLKATGAEPAFLNCHCTPAGISRTASPSIYRLTEDSGAPVSLLDINTSLPRLLIIPPAATKETTPGNQ
jgi:hypothetical protein